MSPVKKLPAELLGIIFVLVDRMANTDQDRKSVMLSCKQWRHIAFRTPELWATIRLGHSEEDIQSDPKSCSAAFRVRTFLSRAGTAALDITWDEEPFGSHAECSIALLLSQSDRWQSFKLFGSHTFMSAITRGANFKNLVHLSINKHMRQSSITPLSGKIYLPQLKSLKLEFRDIWEPLSVVAPLLTELSVTINRNCEADVFLGLLNASPLLESIRVSLRTWGGEVRGEVHDIPALARLREMSINIPYWLLTVSKPIVQSSPMLREVGLGVRHLIGVEPPVNLLPEVETVTFYFGIYFPDPDTWLHPDSKERNSYRKFSARKWLDVFPRASTVRIADEVTRQVWSDPDVALLTKALLLLKLPSPKHKVLFPQLRYLIFETVKIDFALKQLVRFLTRRTWVQDGGKLKPGSRRREDAETDCRVTLKNCDKVGSIEKASLKELEEHLGRTIYSSASST